MSENLKKKKSVEKAKGENENHPEGDLFGSKGVLSLFQYKLLCIQFNLKSIHCAL
jgi:hypothetical protein